MRKSQMTNIELLQAFEIACFQITNYPNNKAKSKEFSLLEKELAKRLNISDEELKEITL